MWIMESKEIYFGKNVKSFNAYRQAQIQSRAQLIWPEKPLFFLEIQSNGGKSKAFHYKGEY